MAIPGPAGDALLVARRRTQALASTVAVPTRVLASITTILGGGVAPAAWPCSPGLVVIRGGEVARHAEVRDGR